SCLHPRCARLPCTTLFRSSTTGTFPNGSFVTGANAPSQAAVDALFGPGACAANGGQRGFGLNPDGTLFCTGIENDPRDVVGYTRSEEHTSELQSREKLVCR